MDLLDQRTHCYLHRGLHFERELDSQEIQYVKEKREKASNRVDNSPLTIETSTMLSGMASKRSISCSPRIEY